MVRNPLLPPVGVVLEIAAFSLLALAIAGIVVAVVAIVKHRGKK